jgi:hypothetical protein
MAQKLMFARLYPPFDGAPCHRAEGLEGLAQVKDDLDGVTVSITDPVGEAGALLGCRSYQSHPLLGQPFCPSVLQVQDVAAVVQSVGQTVSYNHR